MSELETARARKSLRWELMATVSLLSLISPTIISEAIAENDDRPTVWVELGGQLERVAGANGRFEPHFITQTPIPVPYKPESPLDAERPPRLAMGGEAKISLEPTNSNWIFTASLRYGRSNSNEKVKHQTNSPGSLCVAASMCSLYPLRTAVEFAKTTAKVTENHAVLDFMAGKDIGIGFLGHGSDLAIQAGVRFAQFESRSDVTVFARPNIRRYNGFPFPGPSGFPYLPGRDFIAYTMEANSSRSFHGVGPSISFSGATPFAGNGSDAGFTFDWGANASVLFGRQRADVSEQITASRYQGAIIFGSRQYTPVYQTSKHPIRSRSVTVPNVGGFAALSMRFPAGKVSIGYRGDFFFGAMDNGVELRKTGVVSFHGPFATISIGLGR